MKKLFIAGLVSLNCLNAYAGTFYVAPTLVYDSYAAGDIAYLGVHPQLNIGYGADLAVNFFHAAVEIFAYPRSVTIQNNTENVVSLKPKYGYGISILPGYVFDSVVMGYVRIGSVWTNFQELNTTKAGVQVGGGLEVILSEVWSVRAEYDYTRYRSVSGLERLTDGQYSLGAVYRFCE